MGTLNQFVAVKKVAVTRKLTRVFALASFVFVLAAGRLEAGFVNGSFEETPNSLTGWTTSNGVVSTVSSYSSFLAVAEVNFAILEANLTTGDYTKLSQTFSASSGQTLSGSAFFKANDFLPFDDDGYVSIVQDSAVLFSSSVSAVGNFGSTPWTGVISLAR